MLRPAVSLPGTPRMRVRQGFFMLAGLPAVGFRDICNDREGENTQNGNWKSTKYGKAEDLYTGAEGHSAEKKSSGEKTSE